MRFFAICSLTALFSSISYATTFSEPPCDDDLPNGHNYVQGKNNLVGGRRN